MHFTEHITTAQERSWVWFKERAHSKYAVFWLVVISFFEPIISPIVPETLLVAMLLAGSDDRKWKRYALITTTASFFGGIAGYGVGLFAFRWFGEGLLGYLGLGDITQVVGTIIAGNIFIIMIFITFTPIPDKAFTVLSGFLGAPFVPFAAGYLIGRSVRFTLVAYLVHRFGEKVLDLINRYSLYAAGAVVAVLVAYVMVHLNLVPWF